MENELKILDKERCKEMIEKTGPFVEIAFKHLKYDLGGKTSLDFSMGFVAGYLKGNGLTMEESMFGAARYYEVVIRCGATESETGTFKMTLKGGGGSASIDLEKYEKS
jgi:hypothetical protein